MRMWRNKNPYGTPSPELVPDPGFDDPSAWTITTNEGSAEVANGVFTTAASLPTGWDGELTSPVNHTLVIGEFLTLKITIDEFQGFTALRYGSQSYLQIPQGDTTGETVFTLEVTDLSIDELWIGPIVGSFGKSHIVISNISIKEQ